MYLTYLTLVVLTGAYFLYLVYEWPLNVIICEFRRCHSFRMITIGMIVMKGETFWVETFKEGTSRAPLLPGGRGAGGHGPPNFWWQPENVQFILKDAFILIILIIDIDNRYMYMT